MEIVSNAVLFDNKSITIARGSFKAGGSWHEPIRRGGTVRPRNHHLLRFVYNRIEHLPNPVMLDIGASTGSFSLLPAHHPNMFVTAFEPNTTARKLLARNVDHNRLNTRVNIVDKALGSLREKQVLKIPTEDRPDNNPGLATLGTPARFAQWREETVPVTTLDGLGINNVSFIKIDVEGAEYAVLVGATETIKYHQPDILLEYEPENTEQFGYHHEALRAFLENLGATCCMIGNHDLFATWREPPTALTIFAVPKPFTETTTTAQHNAIESWKALTPPPEIILLGDEPGIGAAARKHDVTHLRNIVRNGHGAIDLADIFTQAAQHANNNIMCYVSGDVILTQGVINATKVIATNHQRFMIGGQRTTAPINFAIDTYDVGWEETLLHYASNYGTLDPANGQDYFIYRKGMLTGLLGGIGIGRYTFDNYIPWVAVHEDKAIFVNISEYAQVVHHEHGNRVSKNSPASKHNRKLIGKKAMSLEKPTHYLSADGELYTRGLETPRDSVLKHFNNDRAVALNTARIEHMLTLAELDGRSVLELGCGVGHFTRALLRAGAEVTAIEGRRENAIVARQRCPNADIMIHDLNAGLPDNIGTYDIVIAYGILYHLEASMRALRAWAGACTNALILGTAVLDHTQQLLFAYREQALPNQSLNRYGHYPTVSWVTNALNHVGFTHVTVPSPQPDHLCYRFTPGDTLTITNGEHLKRRVFVARKVNDG